MEGLNNPSGTVKASILYIFVFKFASAWFRGLAMAQALHCQLHLIAHLPAYLADRLKEKVFATRKRLKTGIDSSDTHDNVQSPCASRR